MTAQSDYILKKINTASPSYCKYVFIVHYNDDPNMEWN